MPQSNSAQKPNTQEPEAYNAMMARCEFTPDSLINDLFTCAEPNLSNAQLEKIAALSVDATMELDGVAVMLRTLAEIAADKTAYEGQDLFSILFSISYQTDSIAGKVRIADQAQRALNGLAQGGSHE